MKMPKWRRRLLTKKDRRFIGLLFIISIVILMTWYLVEPKVVKTKKSNINPLSVNNPSTQGSIGLTPNQPYQGSVTVDNAVFSSNYQIGKKIQASDIDVNQLYNLTNQERSKTGVDTLKLNVKLTSAAQSKCRDMVSKNYWSHYSPDGTAPWAFDINQGYSYQKLGENLAVGFYDAQTTISGWMASPEHRTNLLDGAFTDEGFAVCKSEKFAGTNNQAALIIVQHLGEPR